ncbi:MAG: phosphatase PAP2 family protein [Burkholderiales bacterium RIFCSPHIGHO2_12_FULL_65_48]|nr:MAG: phosphatase PAP2 family protein [Burkholderiales bacterium RIFCSPHIGHO2_12_FULL_65_48]
MQGPDTATQWLGHWLYDWGGANTYLLLATQRLWPNGLVWVPELLSAVGSYWGAPTVVILMLFWARVQVPHAKPLVAVGLYKFMFGLGLALAAAALAKAVFALPRPFVELGAGVYRATSAPDSRYTLPSGHAVYIGVLISALWPLLRRYSRIGLLVLGAAVGWSRVVLGAHFPVDVVAGYLLGWACVACITPCSQRLALRRSRAQPIDFRTEMKQ